MATGYDIYDDLENSTSEEIESLIAIYGDDVDITFDPSSSSQSRSVVFKVEPATAHEKSNRYVSLTLVLFLANDYPRSPASVDIRHPRGLSDALVNDILAKLRAQAEDGRGTPILYAIIESAKDFITDQKIPTCGCAICLCDFEERESETDDFLRTDCFHFFHVECLSRFMEYSLRENAIDLQEKRKLNPDAESDSVVCPVCRLELNENLLESLTSPEPSGKNSRRNAPAPKPSRRRLSSGSDPLPHELKVQLERERREREKLFQRQKARGAIIDVEEERRKFKLTFAVAPSNDAADVDAEESDVSEPIPATTTLTKTDAVREPNRRRRRQKPRNFKDNFREKVVFHHSSSHGNLEGEGHYSDFSHPRLNEAHHRDPRTTGPRPLFSIGQEQELRLGQDHSRFSDYESSPDPGESTSVTTLNRVASAPVSVSSLILEESAATTNGDGNGETDVPNGISVGRGRGSRRGHHSYSRPPRGRGRGAFGRGRGWAEPF